MFFNSLFLAISSSIDSFGIGITYGIKNTKISYMAKVVLFFISFIVSIFSIWVGSILKNIIPIFLVSYIGSFMLICMGCFICFQAIKKDKVQNKHIGNDFNNFDALNNFNEEKIYSFFIKFLGITIKIIKNPISSDFDNSNTIDTKEALFLGVALSLDSFCIGISGSMIEINSFIFPLAIGFFQLLLMSLGNFLGHKLFKISKIPDNVWSIISGFLLIIIGFCKFF